MCMKDKQVMETKTTGDIDGEVVNLSQNGEINTRGVIKRVMI